MEKTQNLHELQKILLGNRPQQVATLCPNLQCDFSLLQNVPCTMLCRWWTYLQISGLDITQTCQEQGFSDVFADDLLRATRLFKMCVSPDVRSLKLKLAKLSERQYENYKEIITAFCVLDTRFCAENIMLEKILAENEAHRISQLAVNERFLRINGFSRFKIKRVLPMLLKIVIEQPQTNKPNSLLAAARGLTQSMGNLL